MGKFLSLAPMEWLPDPGLQGNNLLPASAQNLKAHLPWRCVMSIKTQHSYKAAVTGNIAP